MHRQYADLLDKQIFYRGQPLTHTSEQIPDLHLLYTNKPNENKMHCADGRMQLTTLIQ